MLACAQLVSVVYKLIDVVYTNLYSMLEGWVQYYLQVTYTILLVNNNYRIVLYVVFNALTQYSKIVNIHKCYIIKW